MPRDLKHLADDIEVLAEKAVSEAAVKIHYSLQYVSPWWTGTFSDAWDISNTPVIPGVRRVVGGGGFTLSPITQDQVPPRTVPRRAPEEVPPIPTKLGKALYVGNLSTYAAFVVNQPGATRPDFEGNPVTYAQHVMNSKKSGSTARPPSPDWFWIYLQHGRSHFLMRDIDKGFSKWGASVVGGYKQSAM